MDTKSTIRLLIADDSAIIRGLLEKVFTVEEGFEVVASVSNGRKAVDAAKEKRPDLVITDYDMPELDGAEAAKLITSTLGIPVVMLSGDETVQEKARQSGALLFEQKPALSAFKMDALKALVNRVRTAYKAVRVTAPVTTRTQHVPAFAAFKLVCIGASTGGPTAVQTVLSGLGKHFPLPILYTQHIDVGADRKMVEWFNANVPDLTVRLAENGQEARAGNVYMAPADRHLIVDYVTPSGTPVLGLSDEPPERFLRPAVNKLFRSAAHHYGSACLAVLMTGMGRDGAEGCKAVLDAGGHTLVESKETCTVFGMPAAAIELNAASEILARQDIASRLLVLAK